MADRQEAEAAAIRRDLVFAAVLTLPVFVLEMGGHLIPAFHHWIGATIGERMSWLVQFVLTHGGAVRPGPAVFRPGCRRCCAARPT